VPAELDETALAHTKTSGGSPPIVGDELPAGLRLGHFRIERKLGAGGMGEVYLATDLALDRPVALKVLPAHAGSAAARDRLVREARAQARVHHPNVAHIYFIGEDAGRLYFAMEYLAGKTLAERVAGGPMSIDDALAAIRAAVLGLREAQRSGFTHRDVKPSNLMSDEHGIVKVVDFGLVSASASAVTDGPVEQTSLAGTPLYMAPEQARGEPIDLRADIYALGATLFHLISGRPPFHADSVDQLVSLHATAMRPSVPRGGRNRGAVTAIDALIARMMAPSPADRFATYDELLRAIEMASSRHTQPAGFWVRLFATGFDLLIAAAIVALCFLPFGQADSNEWQTAASLAIYTIIALGWRGTTIGKAIFELELVSAETGKRASWRAVIVRQTTWIVPMVVFGVLKQLQEPPKHSKLPEPTLEIAAELILLAIVVLGVADLAVAAWRRPGKRTLWDRVSHTQLRYRATRSATEPLLL
jgi:uncharacterized RDD family membrane protein YckC